MECSWISGPPNPNKALQMETQYVPSVQSVDAKGEIYARIAPLSFPRSSTGDSVVVHRVTAYNKSALWDAVNTWFAGGPPASGTINTKGASVHTFNGKGGATWKIYLPNVPDEIKLPLAWNSFVRPVALDSSTYGYRWNYELATRTDSKDGPLVTLPAYFHLVKHPDKKAEWVVGTTERRAGRNGFDRVSLSSAQGGSPRTLRHA